MERVNTVAKNVTQYDLLISCPGDLESEITIIKEVVEEFNELYSDALGVNIRPRHWSKSSFSQSGDSPQEILNKQFVRDCDAAIAIFWTRFGTPTDQYGSGSEEEIEIMLRANKQVFLYFSEKAIPPVRLDHSQYAKVKAFKEIYKDRGLYFTYSDDQEFRRLFFAHLSQYFLSLPKVEELKKTQPDLKIKAINDQEQLCDDAYIQKFTLGGDNHAEIMIESIKELFSIVSENKLSPSIKSAKLIGAEISFLKTVEIDDDDRDLIQNAAEAMKIDIDSGFFNLGNLQKSIVPTNPLGGGYALKGTDLEEKKYYDIIELRKRIHQARKWIPIEDCFNNLFCLKFVLSNEGTAFDEDIDIELEFIPGMLLQHTKLPIPKKSLEYACDCLSDMFEIEGTSKFLNYTASQKSTFLPSPTPTPTPPSLLSYYSRDYEEDYAAHLDDVFDYQYYNSHGDIIKLHIDYIKQHTAVAFPTPIFVTEMRGDIQYRITSKYKAEVESGIIKIISETTSTE